MMIKRGFSLLEVLFAVAFLIMAGAGMGALGTAALRLTDNAEIKTMAIGLNEEYLTHIGLRVKSAPDAAARDALKAELFAASEANSSGCTKSANPANAQCYKTYLDCPLTPLNAACQFSAASKPVQLGPTKLQFIRKAEIRWPAGANYIVVNTSSSWGGGVSRQVTASQRFKFE